MGIEPTTFRFLYITRFRVNKSDTNSSNLSLLEAGAKRKLLFAQPFLEKGLRRMLYRLSYGGDLRKKAEMKTEGGIGRLPSKSAFA
jgi:hypothetical protein